MGSTHKPNYPGQEVGYFKYLATVDFPETILSNCCIKEAVVTGIHSRTEINITCDGIDFSAVPVLIHTDCGARVASVKGVDLPAEEYFKNSAFMFPFLAGAATVLGTTVDPTVLVVMHTRPGTMEKTCLAAIKVVRDSFNQKANLPPTYEVVVKVNIAGYRGSILEFSKVALFNIIDNTACDIPTIAGGKQSLPLIKADGTASETLINAYLDRGILIEKVATTALKLTGDMPYPPSGVTPNNTATIIASSGTYSVGGYDTCYDDTGSAITPAITYNEDIQSNYQNKTWTYGCYGGTFDFYQEIYCTDKLPSGGEITVSAYFPTLLISELFFADIVGPEKVPLVFGEDTFNFSALSFDKEFANGWAYHSSCVGSYNLETVQVLGAPGIHPCGDAISQTFTETGSVTQTISIVGPSTSQTFVKDMGGDRTTVFNYAGNGYTGTMEANSQDSNHANLILIPAYDNLICSVSMCGRLILSQDTYTTREFFGPNFSTTPGTFSQVKSPLTAEVIGIEQPGEGSFIASTGISSLVGDFLIQEITAAGITDILNLTVIADLNLYVVPFNLEAALL